MSSSEFAVAGKPCLCNVSFKTPPEPLEHDFPPERCEDTAARASQHVRALHESPSTWDRKTDLAAICDARAPGVAGLDAEPEAPETRPQRKDGTDIEWAKICLYVLKYTALIMIPILLVQVPRWALPRALRMKISSAKEFWDNCNRGDTSLEDPHYPVIAGTDQAVFTFALISVFWVLPNDAFPAVHGKQDSEAYAEARRRLGKLWPRQAWGGLSATLFLLAGVHYYFPMMGLADRETVASNMTTMYTLGFFVAACGVVHQASALDAAWANSCPKRIAGIIYVFGYFFVCQMLTITSGRILEVYENVGLLGLQLTANAIVAIAKQFAMRGGGDVGLLSFVSMGVGAAVGIGLRQYVFFKPSISEAFISSMLSTGVTLSGHVMNFVVFKYMSNWIHERAVEAHEAILFSDQVYELTARVISALVLTVADTRFYHVGKTGFGEHIDPGLVLVNFILSLALHMLATAFGIKLMYAARSEMNMAKFAESYRVRHAALALSCLLAATLTLTIGYRVACLICLPADHRDAYSCTDA